MEDLQIVGLFWNRSEQAVEEIQKKYSRYCYYIANQILGNEEDAREVVNDTYMKIWNTIPPNRPKSLKSYAGMIARQLALDAYEARTALKRSGQTSFLLDELAECIPDSRLGDLCERLSLRDALNTFVGNLPRRTRRIFVRRYWYASSVKEIAKDFGMKESTVTVLMLRTRHKLKEFLEKEGVSI